MKLGIIISSNDPETVWNAFRLGNLALNKNDEVKVFLLAKGVEAESLLHESFNVIDQMTQFADNNGEILACKTCLQFRNTDPDKCDISTMADLYSLILESDKVISI